MHLCSPFPSSPLPSSLMPFHLPSFFIHVKKRFIQRNIKTSKDSQITTRLSCPLYVSNVLPVCSMQRIVVLIFTATSLGLQATKRTFSLKKQPCPCATVKRDYVGKGEKIGCNILEPDKGGRILPRKIPKAHNRMLLFISWRHKLNSY